MTNQTASENLAIRSAGFIIGRDKETVETFRRKLTDSIARAISWDGTAAIVAEARLAVAEEFVALWEEEGGEEARSFLQARSDAAQQSLNYFDPTSQSTSASSTFVGLATYKANQAIIEFADSMLRYMDED